MKIMEELGFLIFKKKTLFLGYAALALPLGL